MSATPGSNRKLVRWLLIFAASLIMVDGLFGERGLVAMMRAKHDYEELSAAIARQRTDNTRLREEARRLREDPRAIEEIARRELGLIKPGEKLFIVKDLPPPKP
jgi:cell division protein FtsB